jgi:small conductance mechanosensitive channel
MGSIFTIDRLIALVRILVGLFGIHLAVRIALYFTQKTLEKLFLRGEARDERRRQTIYTLSQSVLRYVLYFFALLAALSLFHVNTASLITAAGIGGLAIGLGTQNLIRDLVAGFFILLEDQFAVGDLVTIGAAEGIVEQIGIRTSAVRDLAGKLYILPNGTIASVIVHRPNPWVIIDYTLAGDEIEGVLNLVTPQLPRWREELGLHAQIQIWPLRTAEKSFLRFAALTNPQERWRVERELRGRIENLLGEQIQVGGAS